MKTFGLIAHPVGHSLSPILHNAAFKAVGLENEYKLFDTTPKQLKARILEMREKDYGGYSVSIPHKTTIIPHLDQIKNKAMQLGAVNTVVNKEGRLIGDNTDYGGFKILLAEQGINRVRNKKAVVLGAGGAAIAIIACLLDTGYTVIVIARDKEKAKQQLKNILISTSGTIAFMGFKDFTPRVQFNLLVNTTPVGMSPKTDESLITNREFFQKERLFIDIIYNPVQTKLLSLAKQAGCRIATGERMFLWQAVGQFELWTGQKAPVKVMEEELLSHLK
jgi:shikimate dehydrogenase